MILEKSCIPHGSNRQSKSFTMVPMVGSAAWFTILWRNKTYVLTSFKKNVFLSDSVWLTEIWRWAKNWGRLESGVFDPGLSSLTVRSKSHLNPAKIKSQPAKFKSQSNCNMLKLYSFYEGRASSGCKGQWNRCLAFLWNLLIHLCDTNPQTTQQANARNKAQSNVSDIDVTPPFTVLHNAKRDWEGGPKSRLQAEILSNISEF